jgi:hypothetical protein
MRKILLIIPLLLPLSSFCQETGIYIDNINLGELLHATPEQLNSMNGEAYGTLGTPYVFTEFKKGNIYFSNKTRVKNYLINYDCYNNRLIFKNGNEHYIIEARQIDYVEFQHLPDSTVLFRQVFLKDKKKIILMKLLYEGESKLYKYYSKAFYEADYTGAYSRENRYDEYKDEYGWYIDTGSEGIRRLKPKKNSILKIMEPASAEIEQYLKKGKPDLKSDEELIRLVEYYDNQTGPTQFR